MNLFFTCLLLFSQTDTVVFKPSDEFEVKLDYQLRKRLDAQHFKVYSSTPDRPNEAIPYIILNIKLLKINANESRLVVHSNLQKNLTSKKIQEGVMLKLDLGFVEDMKSRTTANEYLIHILNSEKVVVNKILIQIHEDGVFKVNDKKRGQF